MSTLQMPTPRFSPSASPEWKPIVAAVDPQRRWASNWEHHKGFPDVEGSEIREILCEMLVAWIWEDGPGCVRKKGNDCVEDHHVTT